MKILTKTFSGFFVLLFCAGILWAGFGITSTFAKVKMDNLQPGISHRVSAFWHPLTVTNTSDIPVTLSLELARPAKNQVENGFEPIPSVAWIALEQDRFKLDPGQSATTDVVVTVPVDKKFLGKKYQFHIHSRAVGSGNICIVLVHKVQVSVVEKMDIESAGRDAKSKLHVDLEQIIAKGVDLGTVMENLDPPLSVRNVNKDSHRYRVEVLSPETVEAWDTRQDEPVANNKSSAGQSEFVLQPGEQRTIGSDAFQNTGQRARQSSNSNNWVFAGDREFELKPGKQHIIPLKLYIPKKDELKAKTFLALVRVTLLSDAFPSVVVPVFASTSNKINESDQPVPAEFQVPVLYEVWSGETQ